jgi:hypothetical protein
MFAPSHHGYPRASRLSTGEASKGQIGAQSRGCAGQTVRPSLHSISQTWRKAIDVEALSFRFQFAVSGIT